MFARLKWNIFLRKLVFIHKEAFWIYLIIKLGSVSFLQRQD